MIVTRKSIRAGEQHLVDHGLAGLVPQFRHTALTTWWSQRVQCAFTLLLIVILLVP